MISLVWQTSRVGSNLLEVKIALGTSAQTWLIGQMAAGAMEVRELCAELTCQSMRGVHVHA
jgi:hypothetical protein